MSLRPYQLEAFEAVVEHITHNATTCLIEAATGCHSGDHDILMADGTFKKAKKIIVGDTLMGADGQPRVVASLHQGYDSMYKITPKKGESFEVNGGHILNLYKTRRTSKHVNEYINITLSDYMHKSEYFKHLTKLHRKKVLFKDSELDIPPWILGALIGDGSIISGTPTFCTPDSEVVSEITRYAAIIGCVVNKMASNRTAPTYSIVDPKSSRTTPNLFTEKLRKCGVWGNSSGNKHVPNRYKISSTKQRLDILAGLLDTDGHLSRGGYDWISKSKVLADDVVYIARSLGLAAYMTECVKGRQNGFKGVYYRVSISGECSIIPCRITRKRAPVRKQKKNVLVTGFNVEYVGNGEYYGFEIDGDHLYLDGSFTVHHNSGKSHIIAAIAEYINTKTGKKVLCLAPSAELVVQNREKYLLTGKPASMYSSSAGRKCLEHTVIFGTEGTVKGAVDKIGKDISTVIIDEAHRTTKTIKNVVKELREFNPYLRVIGLTATPYRMDSGYIYALDQNNRAMSEAKNPYYHKLVCKIEAHTLIKMGYLTQPIIGDIGAGNYSTMHLETNNLGKFNAEEMDAATTGQGRLTSEIIADIVQHSQNRMGVMIFASTIRHTEECMKSLPVGISAVITGKTPKKERKEILRKFKTGSLKYLVNVDVLTTGFDAPNVDVIALMRPTESASLLQQMIGRSLRILEGKKDALILDYAENIERHAPDGDIFNPEITAPAKKKEIKKITVKCPLCSHLNSSIKKIDMIDYKEDEFGYALDLEGQRIVCENEGAKSSEVEPYIPVHHQRRCDGLLLPTLDRCAYRWTFKECGACEAPNDIAARFCTECKYELVDPNEKLKLDFARKKKDPYSVTTDKVISWIPRESISRAGKPMLRVTFKTEYRTFDVFIMHKFKTEMSKFNAATNNGTKMPSTITACKNKSSNFWKVVDYNRSEDEVPE